MKKKEERKRTETIEHRMKKVELTLGMVSMRVDKCGRARVRACANARTLDVYACRCFSRGWSSRGGTARDKKERKRKRETIGPAHFADG